MTRSLKVRVYNVLFGDAILLTIPEVDEAGHPVTVRMLIDVGNALSGEGGRDEVLLPVLQDILKEAGGEPIDLYLMTHEHMDHVQGLLHGSKKLGIELQARHLWMTASSEGTAYYDRFPKAKRKRLSALVAYHELEAFLSKAAAPPPPGIRALLAINNPRSTDDCVDYIRKRRSGGGDPLYIHRSTTIEGAHPFRDAKLRLLAPEEDTSVYYGPLPPRTLGTFLDSASPAAADPRSVTPPAGVSAGDFFDLIAFRSSGMAGNLLAIDKATNNSSVAFELEWKGWRLLFPGDAEEKSWEIMDRRDALRPVHFLKVSHHGSKNGSPRHQIDKILPKEGAPDHRARFAVVSTREGSYNGVPDSDTLTLISERATLHDTRKLADGGWFDLEFPEDGSAPTSRTGP